MAASLFISKNRTKRAVQNIGLSFLLKGGSIIISFILVPLTINYLNTYEYGIWLTLNSVLSWVYLFDIGLGNGLRNKLTEAIAMNDYKLGKIYVSTTYFCMSIIILAIFSMFLLAQVWINWDKILNVIPGKVPHLNTLVLFLFGFFALSFIFRLLGNVFMAKQLSSANDTLAFIGNLLALITIFICTKLFQPSLFLVGCVLAGSPLIVYIVATPIVYHKFDKIAPNIKYVKFSYFKSLLSLGIKFMIIQIASLILFMTSNLIISQLFGPQEVTPYNIAFKLFSAISTIFTIILTPFWSAITDAYIKKEYEWIKKNCRRIIWVWVIGIIGTLCILFASPFLYKIWIGDSVTISFSLSAVCALYVTLMNWNNIWAYIINGTGRLYISFLLAIIQAAIYIPLAIILGKSLGIIGIVLGLCSCMIISGIIVPIQYYKLFNTNASGIWGR